ncbi:MAG: hypothetical protein QOF17_1116, partial [Solirubrobacteraceae bacterium]|nr:hypothetical protein [Solirubrobacteraceae bacterium]
ATFPWVSVGSTPMLPPPAPSAIGSPYANHDVRTADPLRLYTERAGARRPKPLDARPRATQTA